MKQKKKSSLLIGFAAGVIAGFFGSGGGIIVVEGLERTGTDERKAHAASVAVIAPVTALSAALYTGGGHIMLRETLWICGGAAAGGIIGARFLQRIQKKQLRRLFTALMLISGFRMLF